MRWKKNSGRPARIPGLKLADIHQTVTVGTCDVDTAEKLNLELNAPVVFVRRYATDASESRPLVFL